MKSTIHIFWLVTMVIAALARPARADEEIAKPTADEAREHLAKGTRYYRLREFDEAIKEYKTGALVEDAAVFYYDLGQCYRQLGRLEDAIWHYQRFLDRANPLPPKYKKAAEDFIRDMKAEVEKRVVAKPLEPSPATPPPIVISTPPPRTITVVDPPEPWYEDSFGWGLTGTGVVATGVSIWLLVAAKSLDDQANTSSSQQTQNDLHDSAGQRRLAGTIVGVAGGLVLVTGIVKLAITPAPHARLLNTLGLAPTANGFAITGSF